MVGDEVVKRLEKMNLTPSSQIIKLRWFSIIILWFKIVLKRIKFLIKNKIIQLNLIFISFFMFLLKSKQYEEERKV